MPDRLLDLPTVQACLHVGRKKLRALIKSGELPIISLGPKTRRVRESDLDAYIAKLPVDRPDGDAA